MTDRSYLQYSADSPSHISVGAIVYRPDKHIACHYFDQLPILHFSDLYLLMRESLESNESLEQALARGLQEEWGMKATLQTYLGSIVSHFHENSIDVEKTTLYFLCRFQSQDDADRAPDDPEGTHSQLQWHPIDFLVPKMQAQGQRLQRPDMDESAILSKAVNHLQ